MFTNLVTKDLRDKWEKERLDTVEEFQGAGFVGVSFAIKFATGESDEEIDLERISELFFDELSGGSMTGIHAPNQLVGQPAVRIRVIPLVRSWKAEKEEDITFTRCGARFLLYKR